MRLDAAARTAFPVLVCALINVAAYFQAKGVDALVGAAFVRDAGSEPAPSTAAERPAAGSKGSDGDVRVSDARTILEHNVFDSTYGQAKAAPGEVTAARESICDGVRAALIAFRDDPQWSFATLEAPGTRLSMRRVGDQLDGRTVLAIAPDHVVLGAGNTVCEVGLSARN